MKKTICLFLVLSCVLLTSCRKSRPAPLRIACDDEMLPVATALGSEFQKAFGVEVKPTGFSAEQLATTELTQYDFMMTDDHNLVKHLIDFGTISSTTAFAETSPALVMRKSDGLSVLKVDDLFAPRERSLRLTIATKNATLHAIVASKLPIADPAPNDTNEPRIVLVPFIVGEISSDGSRQRTTPASMLQQLRDKETDVIVCWDFTAAEAVSKQPNTDDFVVVNWAKETDNTIAIPLCLIKDCRGYAGCKTFVDFVKSSRGREILQSNFLTPANDLVGGFQ